MTDQQKEFLRQEYLSRIYRVMDHIEKNIDEELSLKKLADIAHFSPYHFHRIFGSLVGETLGQFILRLRLQKAATFLLANPKTSVTDIAYDCGFSSSAHFARSFKEFYKISASEWRKYPEESDSKISQIIRKNKELIGNLRKDIKISSQYNGFNNLIWRITMKTKLETKVEVKEMQANTVAYVRHIGPYKGDSKLFENLYNKLFKWAGPRELLNFPQTKVMAVYHDDPEITEEQNLRTSACISIPKETKVDGEIGKMTIPGGKFAVARFELLPDEYQDAWNMVMAGWLPESGYQCDDRLCFELYHNNANEHPEKKCIVDICIPVRPL